MNEIESIILAAIPDVAPSISLMVLHHGDVIHHQAWGDATTTTLFDLASLTKLFTTTAFLTLSPDALHTPLVDFVPEFGRVNPRGMDGGQDPHSKEKLPTPTDFIGKTIDPSKVTLWHLLTHTSGLPPWRDIYNASPPPQIHDDPYSTEDRWQRALERLYDVNFVDEVGAGVRYSDIGLMLLGEVVARLNQTSLGEAIQQQVLTPLNLTSMMFNPVKDHHVTLEVIAPTEIDATWRKRRVWGEVHDENACGVGGIAGHAGLFGTAGDVAQFGQTWLTRVKHPSIWQQAIQQHAVTNDERRGLGWMLPSIQQKSNAGDLMSREAFGHTGFTGTSLWIDPTRELVIALMTNRVYVGRERPGIFDLRRAIHDAIIRSIS